MTLQELEMLVAIAEPEKLTTLNEMVGVYRRKASSLTQRVYKAYVAAWGKDHYVYHVVHDNDPPAVVVAEHSDIPTVQDALKAYKETKA